MESLSDDEYLYDKDGRRLYDEEDFDFSQETLPAEEGENGYIGTSDGSSQSPAPPLVVKNISVADLRGKGTVRNPTGKSSAKGDAVRRDRSRSPLEVRKVTFVGGDGKEIRQRSGGSTLRSGESPRRAEEESREVREQRIAARISMQLREEMRDILRDVNQTPATTSEDLEKLKLDHRTNSLMVRAGFLTSDGAKAQFAAFAKVKANVEDARAKILAGEKTAALAALDRLEKVADLRLELVERADKLPGGWAAATIFERMAQSEDANQGKFDKIWKSACGELEEKKTADAKRSAFRGRASAASHHYRGSLRGNYSFRSVLLFVESYLFTITSPPSFLCGYLDQKVARIYLSFHEFIFEFC